MHITHGLFLTWTRKSHHIQIIYYNIYTSHNASSNPTPCSSLSCVYLLGEPTALLGVADTLPLLSLVCQQLPHPLQVLPPFHTPQLKLQYLHRQHKQQQSSSSGTVISHNVFSISAGFQLIFSRPTRRNCQLCILEFSAIHFRTYMCWNLTWDENIEK